MFGLWQANNGSMLILKIAHVGGQGSMQSTLERVPKQLPAVYGIHVLSRLVPFQPLRPYIAHASFCVLLVTLGLRKQPGFHDSGMRAWDSWCLGDLKGQTVGLPRAG